MLRVFIRSGLLLTVIFVTVIMVAALVGKRLPYEGEIRYLLRQNDVTDIYTMDVIRGLRYRVYVPPNIRGTDLSEYLYTGASGGIVMQQPQFTSTSNEDFAAMRIESVSLAYTRDSFCISNYGANEIVRCLAADGLVLNFLWQP